MKKRPASENKPTAEPIELPPRLVEVYCLLTSIARQRRAGLLGSPPESPSLTSSIGHIPPGLEGEDLPSGECPRADEGKTSLKQQAHLPENNAGDPGNDHAPSRKPRDTPDPTI